MALHQTPPLCDSFIHAVAGVTGVSKHKIRVIDASVMPSGYIVQYLRCNENGWRKSG